MLSKRKILSRKSGTKHKESKSSEESAEEGGWQKEVDGRWNDSEWKGYFCNECCGNRYVIILDVEKGGEFVCALKMGWNYWSGWLWKLC